MFCTKCEKDKDPDEFSNRNGCKRGKEYHCKECKYEENSLWKKNNREKVNQIQKNWNTTHKEESILLVRKCANNYRKNHPDYQKNYVNNKLNTDSLYKLKHNIRTLIKFSLVHKQLVKNSKTTNILGCTFEEFKLYLEKQFESWMNWENYGKYNGTLNYGWDMDHIIPLGSVSTEEAVLKLNHYTNFQPLDSYINRVIKRDKI